MIRIANKIEDVLTGATIFGVKKRIAKRIDSKLAYFNLKPYSVSVSFKNSRQVRLLISADSILGEEMDDYRVQDIAMTIAKDLRFSMGYKVEGHGFFNPITDSALIILTQTVRD